MEHYLEVVLFGNPLIGDMAQPQIQKKYLTLRPIISDIGGPTHALSRHLTNLLSLFIGMNPSFIKDSCYFINKIQNTILDDSDLMVSFNVVSLLFKFIIPQVLDIISNIFY